MMTEKTDILLINPFSWIRDGSPAYLPYGVLYLAGYVRAQGIRVDIFDANTDASDPLEMVARKRPLAVGLSVLTGPVINEAQLKRVHEYTEIGKKEGAKLLLGGDVATEGALKKGFFYKPTIFTDVGPSMRIAQEEIFGPSVAVLRAKSLEEAIEICNSTNYGLSSAIYTRDVDKAFRAIQDIVTGIVYVNA